MDETTPHTPQNGTCELLLDYVYGELDEARKRTFEEHLPGCARCQQEAASFGRVRTAVKTVMPAVEPTAPLAGALHAQLMHAAAQRKPRRGVLLAFPRKIVEHPALSAAAMFVLVGGAIAINWSRGKMAMPATAEHEVADSAKPEVAVAEPAVPKPALEPTLAPADAPKLAEKKKEEQDDSSGKLALGNKGSAGYYKAGDKAQTGADDQTRIALETPSGTMTVQRPAAAHRATATPTKQAPPRMKNIAVDGKMAKLDQSLAKDEGNGLGGLRGAETGSGAVAGGVIGGGGRGELQENAKSSAPQELPRKTVAAKAPARDASQHGYAAGVPAASTPPAQPSTAPQYDDNAPAAPPPVTVAAPTSTEREADYLRSSSQQAAPVQKPTSTSRNFESLRKQANENAKTGRCDEAIKLYQELDKAGQRISPTDRLNWVRCLTQNGRQEEAQQRLDALKSEKRVPNGQLQDAEKELNDSRRRSEVSKKAKKAPAAADRAAQPQQSQQRPAEPASQSPPDSTNTKVQKPAY
jgi:putative zinc finger protein